MKNKSLKTKGLFYIPEYQDQKIYGELIIEDNSIKLELLGGLPDTVLLKDKKRNISVFNNEPEYKKVLGMTNEGSVVLLKNHFGRSQRFKFLTETSEKFPVAFISEEDLTKNTNLEFSEIIFSCALLNTFVGKSNISQQHELENNRYKKVTVDLDLSCNSFFSCMIDAKYKFSFEPTYSFQLTGSGNLEYNDAPIKEFIKLVIRKKEKKICKDELLELVFRLKDFIAFGLDKPIYLTEVIGRNKALKKLALNTNIDSKYLNTQIYIVEKDSDDAIQSVVYDHLFKLPMIENEFSEYISNWLKIQEKYPVLYNNYFTTLYNQNVLFESAFLKLFIGTQDFFKKNKTLFEKIKLDDEEINFVSTNKEKGETTLKDLVIARKSLVNSLIKRISLEDVSMMKDIRNGIAHGGLTSADYDNIRNNFLFKKLLWINQHSLMKAIGFNDTLIEKIFDKVNL